MTGSHGLPNDPNPSERLLKRAPDAGLPAGQSRYGKCLMAHGKRTRVSPL
jgi:hypothetical protein